VTRAGLAAINPWLGGLLVVGCAVLTFAALELTRGDASGGAPAPRLLAPTAATTTLPAEERKVDAAIDADERRRERENARRVRALKQARRKEARRLRRERREAGRQAATLRERARARPRRPAAPAPVPAAPKTATVPPASPAPKDTGGQKAPEDTEQAKTTSEKAAKP
jgi:hypothetical protein